MKIAAMMLTQDAAEYAVLAAAMAAATGGVSGCESSAAGACRAMVAMFEGPLISCLEFWGRALMCSVRVSCTFMDRVCACAHDTHGHNSNICVQRITP
jgi:hypothetical protein